MIWLEHKFNYKLIDHVYDSFTSSKRYIIETGSRGTGFKLYYVLISVGFYTDISKLLSPAWSAARSLDGDLAARAYQLALKFSYSSNFRYRVIATFDTAPHMSSSGPVLICSTIDNQASEEGRLARKHDNPFAMHRLIRCEN